jgi:hypothetical protein
MTSSIGPRAAGSGQDAAAHSSSNHRTAGMNLN